MRIASVGHAAFVAVMIALGIQGLTKGDFTAVWQPVPKGVPVRGALVYLSAFISMTCGIGLTSKRWAPPAARVLLAYLVIWLLLFRVSDIVRAPTVFGAWDGGAETAVIVAGAWVLYSWCARLAAALSALQIGMFTLLVWVPIVAAGSKDPYQWSEFAISCALTAAAWVVADSYRLASFA